MPFVKDMNEKPWKIIDEERGAVFYRKGATGGSSDPMDVFELHWSGGVVTVVVKSHVFNKSEVEYEIRALTISESLKPKQIELVELISEALDVYGFGWRRDWLDAVSVSLSTDLKFQKGASHAVC